MNDHLREITHNNVERLLAAIVAEREARAKLQERFDALQKHVNQMTVDLAQAKQKANAAFAIARNTGGSTHGDND